jgi:hypothetical protein
MARCTRSGGLVHVADILREGTRDTSLVPRAKNRAQQQLVPCLRRSVVHLSLQTYRPHRFSGARTRACLAGLGRNLVPLSQRCPFLTPMRCMKSTYHVFKYQGISVQDIEEEDEEASCAIRDRCLVLATVICRWAYCTKVVAWFAIAHEDPTLPYSA